VLIEREDGDGWESYMRIDPVRSADDCRKYVRMLAASKGENALRSYTNNNNNSDMKRKRRGDARMLEDIQWKERKSSSRSRPYSLIPIGRVAAWGLVAGARSALPWAVSWKRGDGGKDWWRQCQRGQHIDVNTETGISTAYLAVWRSLLLSTSRRISTSGGIQSKAGWRACRETPVRGCDRCDRHEQRLQNMLEFTFNRLAPNLAIQRLSVDSTITTAIIICGMLGLDFP
jgi:hypothetical protein